MIINCRMAFFLFLTSPNLFLFVCLPTKIITMWLQLHQSTHAGKARFSEVSAGYPYLLEELNKHKCHVHYWRESAPPVLLEAGTPRASSVLRYPRVAADDPLVQKNLNGLRHSLNIYLVCSTKAVLALSKMRWCFCSPLSLLPRIFYHTWINKTTRPKSRWG